MRAVMDATGCRISWSGIFAGEGPEEGGKNAHYEFLAWLDELCGDGYDLIAQVSSRPFTVQASLARPFMFGHDACEYKWFNQTLCQVNGSVVRVGVIEGEYHWHKHDEDDEFFYTVEGLLLIDLEDRVVEVKPGQGFVVPRGVVHRTRAPQRTVILMVENAGIIPTGN